MAGVRGLEGDEGGGTADGVEQPGSPQLLGDGDRVGGLAGGRQRGDGLEDVAVGRLVEVLGVEDLRGDGDGVLGEEHRPEEGLLGLEVVGRGPPRSGRARNGTGLVVDEAHGPPTLPRAAWGSVGEQPRFLLRTALWTECGQRAPPVERRIRAEPLCTMGTTVRAGCDSATAQPCGQAALVDQRHCHCDRTRPRGATGTRRGAAGAAPRGATGRRSAGRPGVSWR